MARASERLRRYLDDELGDCRDEDVERRLDELGTLEAALGTASVDAELDVLSALANETRYTLVRVLVAAREELCVCELNAVVDVSESGLSHAFSDLVDAGLVEGRKDGRWKKYRATNRAVTLVSVVEGTVAGDVGDGGIVAGKTEGESSVEDAGGGGQGSGSGGADEGSGGTDE